jgi:hypothetical protein
MADSTSADACIQRVLVIAESSADMVVACAVKGVGVASACATPNV